MINIRKCHLSLALPSSLLEEISVMARAVFDSSLWELRVAVRSSAVGEDGLDHSSAGQNETLLGVRGEREVTAGILACWASLYGPRSVEYRRQAGGGVVGQMSVVIQEMVRASKAGVIFTAVSIDFYFPSEFRVGGSISNSK